MRVGKMPKGNTYWDFNGDGQFSRCLATGRQARSIRKWWVRHQKRQMDDPGDEK